MAVSQIIHFSIKPLLDTQPATVDDTVQKAVQSLKGAKTLRNFVFGRQIQDKTAIQITSEWDDVQDYTNFKNTAEFSSFVKSMSRFCGEPQNTLHVALDQSAFGPDGPAAANVVEFVQVYFPASRVTPDFQKQIEADFSKFEEIFRTAAKGDVGLVLGWVLEEQEHEDIKDEKAKCFFVIRGWESMDMFEQSIKHNAYKEAIPLLLAWNTPFKMWHVERKGLGGSDVVA